MPDVVVTIQIMVRSFDWYPYVDGERSPRQQTTFAMEKALPDLLRDQMHEVDLEVYTQVIVGIPAKLGAIRTDDATEMLICFNFGPHFRPFVMPGIDELLAVVKQPLWNLNEGSHGAFRYPCLQVFDANQRAKSYPRTLNGTPSLS